MNDYKSSQTLINHVYNVITDVMKKWQTLLLICVTCALIYDTIQTFSYVPMYRCEATFAIKSSSGISYQNNGTIEQNIGETFSYIFSSNVFKKEIEENMDVDSLEGTFSVMVQPGTNLLNVYADSTSPRTSFEMMIALIENYRDISHLVVGSANIDLINDVKFPTNPYNSLSHKENIKRIGMISFIVCAGILAMISILNNTIKDKYEIEKKLKLRLLGSLPKESKITDLKHFKTKKAILISQYSTSFHYIESMKRIRSRIEKKCHKDDMKVILMTSSLENEGKSSVSVNIALSLAMNKKKVLLIDTDLRKPSLHLIFDKDEEGYGIDDILHNHIHLDEAIVHQNEYLDVLYNYHPIENCTEDIQSKTMKELITEAKMKYDYVIIDSAPARFLSDTSMLASYADGIILVVKQNYATETMILNTIDKLTLSKTPIIGCIHNQGLSISVQSGKYYGYNHYYNHRRREE